MKSKCENCPYNRNELGNGCGNDYCIQEAVMFDVGVDELKNEQKEQETQLNGATKRF